MPDSQISLKRRGLSLRRESHIKYNGIQPAIKARNKTKLGSQKNLGRGLICARASRAYTNLFVNSERSEHLNDFANVEQSEICKIGP